jgi:23S rRNA (adenine2503-C2)-methyltransferase
MRRIIQKSGKPSLARVLVAQMGNDPGRSVECVDACDPLVGARRKKWVIVISTQFGCPSQCLMCDAGGDYKGNLSRLDMRFQIDSILADHPGIDPAECAKLKIQFARMGEPSFNDEVLEVLQWLGAVYPRAIPCLATIAPADRGDWFGRLLGIRDRFRDFQLQFSCNTTSPEWRDKLMPYAKMPWDWMAEYGREFSRRGQRKPCLNFALCPEVPVEAGAVRELFDPDRFVVKLTPLNPTAASRRAGLTAAADHAGAAQLVESKALEFERLGYRVIRSVGDMEENGIGSNCGQSVRRMLESAAA